VILACNFDVVSIHTICKCCLPLHNLYMVNIGNNLVDDFTSSLDKLNSYYRTNIMQMNVYFPLARSSLIFLPLHPFDFLAITMSRKRGKSKHEPAYYNFMACQLRLGPSSSPISSPSTSPSLVGSLSVDSPLTNPNWRRDDNNLVFIEEEFPLVPPNLLQTPI
jgi:hypothetical protein